MKITRNWLDKFLNLSNIKNEQISTALNSLGFEVESFKDYSKLNQNLTLAQVSSATPIEGTHLNFTFVDTGEELVSPVVCGASNVKEGQFVVLIRPGQSLSNGLEIGTREIKGKTSEGMICSLEELGLEKNSLTEKEQDWIYEIHTRTDTYSLIGNKDVLNRIGFNDAVWEVDLTLNRSDCLSAFQLAKEIANYFKIEFKIENKDISAILNQNSNSFEIKVSKELENEIISISQNEVILKEINSIDQNWNNYIYSKHDLWLKFCGIKTEHNFYKDLANIITLETGQPVLFLDADKISTLNIANEPNEKYSTNIVLKNDSEVISNIGVDIDEKYLPTKNSKRILVIYLAINPILMRKQQKAFNNSSVSMQRYMKPISSFLSKLAFNRVCYYLDHYRLISNTSKLHFNKEPQLVQNLIQVDINYIKDILGIEISSDQIIKLFDKLDFKITVNKDILLFEIDKYRTDIWNQADIAEEVARLYGYNNIEEKPPILFAHEKAKNLNYKIQKNVEGILIGKGFNNVKTYSLINKEEAEKFNLFNIKDPINLMSPLSNLRETYRLSLFSSLIEIASSNSNKGNKNLKFYEFADIYNVKNLRETRLGLISTGDYISESYRKAFVENNFAFNKTNIINVLSCFNIKENDLNFGLMESNLSEIHPFLSAKISLKNEVIGFMFKLSPRTEQKLKLQKTFVTELNFTKIQSLFNRDIQANELSKFQKSNRVITLELNAKNSYQNLINKAVEDVKYITNISISDIYSDEQMEQNQMYALSLQFEFNNIESQLTDEQITAEWNRLIKNVQNIGIVIR